MYIIILVRSKINEIDYLAVNDAVEYTVRYFHSCINNIVRKNLRVEVS